MKAYPAYKDSGVEWLGEIPEGWRSKRLGHVATTLVSNVDKHTKDNETPVRLCNYVDVYKNDIITDDIEFMKATASADQIVRFQLRPGDTTFTKDSETAEDIGIPALIGTTELVCGYHLAIAQPDRRFVDPKFLFYVLRSDPSAKQWYLAASGVTRVGLRSADIPKLRIALPSLLEQQAIAAYLDRETAQIDELICEQEALIESLTERRRSVITHAITKGLDPTAEMKDSAIEWLGSVPTHWHVQPISHSFEVVLGKMLDGARTARTDDVTLPYLRAANVQDTGLALASMNEMAFTTAERLNLDLRAGDLLIVEGGAIGTTHRLHEDMPCVSFQKTLNRVRPRTPLNTRMLQYMIRAFRDSGVLDVICNKSTIPHLTAEKLLALRVLMPPPMEQTEIADYLDSQTSAIDTLTTECRELISLLKERRSALISAAVTGKIDVREAAA